MGIIFHITTTEKWEEALQSGQYEAESLETRGLIHCSDRDQLVDVANANFQGRDGLVLLAIDSDSVTAEIRYENLDGGEAQFPHIYGPLDIEAVFSVFNFVPGPDGKFSLPDCFG